MNSQNSKSIYRLATDDPPKLLWLLSEARAWRLPVALVAIDDRLHTTLHKVGVPVTVTRERVTLRMEDGGECKVPLWQIDRLALIEECEVAA